MAYTRSTSCGTHSCTATRRSAQFTALRLWYSRENASPVACRSDPSVLDGAMDSDYYADPHIGLHSEVMESGELITLTVR